MNSHRLAFLTTIATYILLLAGGLVHSKGAGLACPDWPLCYGMFFPPMVGNIRFEHGHRLIAASVGFLTALTSVWVWRNERLELRPLAMAAVGIIGVQIVLGALTVIFLLPDLVSTAHLAVGTGFFCLLVILTFLTAPEEKRRRTEVDRKTRIAILAATAAVFSQMVLGALVRHTGSGLACPGIPDCRGHWFLSPTDPAGLQMLHRYVSLAVMGLTFWVWSLCRALPGLRGWAALSAALTFAQIGVGVWSVLAELSVLSVMVHLGMAILILLSLVMLSVKTIARPRTATVPAMVEA